MVCCGGQYRQFGLGAPYMYVPATIVAQAPFKKLFKKLFESFKECQDHPPYDAATPLETTRPRQTLCVLARTVEPECVIHKCRPH